MDPITMAALISGGSGLLGGLLNKDKYSTSPYTEEMWKHLKGQLDKPWVTQGLSPLQRKLMGSSQKEEIGKQSATAKARSRASMSRRGVTSPGMMTSMETGISGKAGELMGGVDENILAQHLQLAKERYGNLQGMATGVSGQQSFMPGGGTDFGGAAGNLMQYLLMKGNKPGAGGGYSSPNFMQGLQGVR